MTTATLAPPEQARARRSRLRILEAALALFGRDGYDGTTFHSIATEAGVSVGLVCRYFPTKEHLVVAEYDRLAVALQAWSVEMPDGPVAVRFKAAMEQKLALLRPHRRSVTALAARALDPGGRASILGATTEVVRSKVASVFWLAVSGATDAPPSEECVRLARVLYGVHLLLVLLYVQEGDEEGPATHDALDLVCLGIAMRAAVGTLALGPFAGRLDGLLARTLSTSRALEPSGTARLILDRIFRRRRLLPGTPAAPSEAARLLHLGRVQSFVDAGEPIQLVLPAFPAKAPNARKVLGKLPDEAEALALTSLKDLLEEISEAYPPGADLIVCSDGHVFADLVGVTDTDVKAYRRGLETMIDALGGGRIRVFGLDDAFGAVKPDKARALLLASYAADDEEIHARAERSSFHRIQIEGIHRLLFEDEIVRAPEVTRTQARKVTRARAYEVVRRSDAWSSLVATAFPRAVRLSIHPQPDVSPKIGIALVPTEDAWLTPWHGVALVGGDHARLVHRSDAEALGAKVVWEDGRPSYMVLGGAGAP